MVLKSQSIIQPQYTPKYGAQDSAYSQKTFSFAESNIKDPQLHQALLQPQLISSHNFIKSGSQQNLPSNYDTRQMQSQPQTLNKRFLSSFQQSENQNRRQIFSMSSNRKNLLTSKQQFPQQSINSVRFKGASSVASSQIQEKYVNPLASQPLRSQVKNLIETLGFINKQLSQLMKSANSQEHQVSNPFISLLQDFKDYFKRHYLQSKEVLTSCYDKNYEQELKIKELEDKIHSLIFGSGQQTQNENKDEVMKFEKYDDFKTLAFQHSQLKKEHHDLKIKSEARENELKNINSLLELKLQHKVDSIDSLHNDLLNFKTSSSEQDLKLALQKVSNWSEEEMKKRERLIMQLQQDKGDLRDTIFNKEEEIQQLKLQIQAKEQEVKDNQRTLDDYRQANQAMDKSNHDIAAKLKKVKDKYKKKEDELYQQKNLTQKFKDLISKLEKELKKGFQNGVVVQYEEMIIEDLVRTSNLFRGPQNIYAINNTAKVNLNYRSNLLSQNNTGIEKKILQQWHDESRNEGFNDSPHTGLKSQASTLEDLNLDTVSLHMHNLARPTFYFLVEHELMRLKDVQEKDRLQNEESPAKHLQQQQRTGSLNDRSYMSVHMEKIKYEAPHKMWLFVTMRAIFDAKYAEHKLYSSLSTRGSLNIQRFPEFVYQWIGNFYYDIKNFRVRALDPFEKDKCDNLRLQLLIGLQAMKPSKMWECNLFVEFLEERFLNDDLYFYLHTRNLLFSGPQLKDIDAAQEGIYFVDEKQVQSVVDLMFNILPPQEYYALKEKFTKIAKDKTQDLNLRSDFSESLPLDSQLVLRVLLEYYRNEKKAKAYIIKRLFKEIGASQPNSNITFAQLKDILEQLQPDISSSDLASLYRESWMVGNGKVNFDSFFLAANENNFFVKWMLLKGHSKPPVLDHNNEIQLDPYTLQGDQLDMAKQQSHIYQLWLKIERTIKELKVIIEQFGNEELYKEINFLDNVLQQKAQFDSSVLQGRDIIQIFRQLMIKVQLLRAVFLEIEEREPMLTKSYKDIQNEFNLDTILSQFELLDKELKTVKEVKGEEVQRARSKQRSNQNWQKLKDGIAKKYAMIFRTSLKYLQYDSKQQHYYINKSYIEKQVLPRFTPYKDCALLDKATMGMIDHEKEKYKRLKSIETTRNLGLGVSQTQKNIKDCTKEDFTQEKYTQHISASKFLTKDSYPGYKIQLAHTKIIDSRPQSPETIEKRTQVELFGQENKQCFKKRLNYLNYTNAEEDIINEQPLRHKLVQENFKYRKYVYERPQAGENAQLSIRNLNQIKAKLQRDKNKEKQPMLTRNINNIPLLQQLYKTNKLDPHSRNVPDSHHRSQTQHFNIKKFYKFSQETGQNYSTIDQQQRFMTPNKVGQESRRPYENYSECKTEGSQYRIFQLENKVQKEVQANDQLRKEALNLWQQQAKYRQKTPGVSIGYRRMSIL